MKKGIKNIFLVEDDLNFGAVMRSYLQMNGYFVNWVDDGRYAVKIFGKGNYHLCILDVMLPNVDGFSIAKGIKDIDKDIPLIFLTAKSLKADIMKGFNLGTDDYITKPFDSDILLLKIEAILKRNEINKFADKKETEFSIGKYSFNSKTGILIDGKNQNKLSPKESDLLKLLCLCKGEILDHKTALTQIWSEEGYFPKRSMDVYITKLRKYLKNDKSIEIVNIHGRGYILKITK